MVTFTESATLIVKDQSTPQIKRINAALKQLQSTANSLKSMKINLTGLTKASADARRLTADLNKLKTSAINLRVNTSGISAAQRQVNQLHTQARRPITLRTAALAAGAYGAVHGVARATREGTRTLDIGETSLALKEIPAERRKYIDEQIRQISEEQSKREGGAMWNRGHIMQQYSEMAGVVKIGAAGNEADFRQRAGAAKYLADQNLELAGTFVKLGMSQDQAAETSAKFGKAMEQQGKIFGPDGKLDIGAAAAEYNNIRKLIPAIGKEATGENYLALMKYLQVSKMSLEPEAIASAMFKFEEMGTQAAVGINQLIKNLSGGGKKSATKEMARLGLLGPKGEIPESDSDLLRRSPQTYVNERLIPRLEADLRKQGKTDAQIQTMLSDPQKSGYVARETQKLVTDRTAQNMLASMILLRQENAEALKDYRSRSGTMESQRKATGLSVIGATTAVSNQFQGLMGEAVRAIAPALVPTLGLVSDTIRKAAEGDRAAQAQLAAGTVAAGIATKLASPIAQAVIGLATPLGLTAGLAGAADSNPAVRSLSTAAIALIGAAEALKNAADYNLLAMGKKVLKGGLAIGAGALHLSGSEPPEDWANATPAERERIYARDAKKYQLYLAEQQLKALEEGKTVLPGKQDKRSAVQGALQDVARLTELRKELVASIATLTKEVEQLSSPSKPMDKSFFDSLPKGIPIPKADPRKSGFLTDPAETIDLGRRVSEASNARLIDLLSTANNNFELTFNTLPSKVSEGGNQAGASIVGVMNGGAAGIGSAIGDAFAARASQVRVGVDASTIRRPDSPLDTGANSARD